jgi:hypothetical protein
MTSNRGKVHAGIPQPCPQIFSHAERMDVPVRHPH